MLLQNHVGVVHILPALPTYASPKRKATGLLARGGFEVDIEWEESVFKTAAVKSTIGGKLRLRVGDGVGFQVNGKKYCGFIKTAKGSKYIITES